MRTKKTTKKKFAIKFVNPEAGISKIFNLFQFSIVFEGKYPGTSMYKEIYNALSTENKVVLLANLSEEKRGDAIRLIKPSFRVASLLNQFLIMKKSKQAKELDNN